MDEENRHFEKLVAELRTTWRGQRLEERQNVVWAVFKDQVPRRHRTCDSVEALLDILVDRGCVSPWDTRQLLKLSKLFPGSQQRASKLITAYNKITAQSEQGNGCSMCEAGSYQQTPTTLALQSKLQQNKARAELLSAILYLCRRLGDRWRDLVRRFPAPLLVREADINRIEAMACATNPSRKNCPQCSGYEALYAWSKRHSNRVDVTFLRDCLKRDLGLRSYAKELDGHFHLSEEVNSKCLLLKADVYRRDALPEESVPIAVLAGHIVDEEETKVPLQ